MQATTSKNGKEITREQLGALCRGQKLYYQQMLQAGYVLPMYSSTLVTRDFLDGCRAGAYWVPRAKEGVVSKYVINPPPKSELIKLFKQGVNLLEQAKKASP